MKKVIVLSMFALGLTLMSFSPKNASAVELQANGTYKVSNLKMSEADIDFLISETSELEGAKIFKTVKIFKTKAHKDSVSEVITVDETKTDIDPEGPIVLSKVNGVIQKYMD